MRLLVIDGNSIANRAFYGIKLLTTKDGRYTNAIFGFLNIMNSLLRECEPDEVAVAFDLKHPTFRHEMYDGYKGTRHAMPDELAQQMPILKELLTDLIPPMPITDDVLLICIFGGLINGFAISLCLRGRATSGGTDFISIALSQQYDVDAWNYIFMGNVVMLAVSGALFGWDKALYSILFQFASTQVIKLLDPSGRRATLFIVTRRETAQAVWQQIRDTHHSATLFQGTGLYDGEERVMLYSVVGGNQVRALIHRVRQTDPHAFVNVMRTDQVAGRFYRAPRD